MSLKRVAFIKGKNPWCLKLDTNPIVTNSDSGDLIVLNWLLLLLFYLFLYFVCVCGGGLRNAASSMWHLENRSNTNCEGWSHSIVVCFTGYKIPVIENLGATLDQFDTIDFSENEIRKLDGFPLLKRLKTLLMNSNRIWWVQAYNILLLVGVSQVWYHFSYTVRSAELILNRHM